MNGDTLVELWFKGELRLAKRADEEVRLRTNQSNSHNKGGIDFECTGLKHT